MGELLVMALLVLAVLFGLMIMGGLVPVTRTPSKAAQFCVGLMLIAGSSVNLYIGYNIIKADYMQYKAESACVAKYIAQQIERRDIVTEKGTCYVRDN